MPLQMYVFPRAHGHAAAAGVREVGVPLRRIRTDRPRRRSAPHRDAWIQEWTNIVLH